MIYQIEGLTFLRRLGSSLISVAFLFTHVLFVHSAEKNFWAERRQYTRDTSRPLSSKDQNQLFAQLPHASQVALGITPGTVFQADARFSIKNNHFEGRALSPLEGNVPSWIYTLLPYGSIRELHLSKRSKSPVIIHIQDAHGIGEAQRNIAAMIRGLGESNGINLIGLEGASGGFDLTPFRDWPDAAITRDIASAFLENGKIGGPEYLGLTASRPPVLWGVEDTALYLENVNALRDSFKEKPVLEKILTDFKTSATLLKKTHYSKNLIEFDTHFQNYQGGKESLGSYVRYLMDGLSSANNRPPNLALLLKALLAEEGLDFKEVERERLDLVRLLVNRLHQKQLDLLVKRSLLYRSGQIGFGEYHRFMRNICRDNEISLDDYPQLNDYISYVLLADKIDRNALLDELTRLEKSVQTQWAVTLEQKRLVGVSRCLTLLDKLMVQAMTPEEWADYKIQRPDFLRIESDIRALGGHPSAGLTSKLLSSFEDFFRIAIERNHALHENLSQQMGKENVSAAVLVAGGFHSEGLSQLFKRKGLSYVVVTPKITEAIKDNHYLDVFARDPLPLEKLFSGEKIFLKTAIGISDRPIPVREGDSKGLKRDILTAQPLLQVLGGEEVDVITRLAEERMHQAGVSLGVTISRTGSETVQLTADMNQDGVPDLVRVATSQGQKGSVEHLMSPVLDSEKVGKAFLFTGRPLHSIRARSLHRVRALARGFFLSIHRQWIPLRSRLARDLHWEDRFLRRAGVVQIFAFGLSLIYFGPHLWVFAVLTPGALVFTLFHIPGVLQRYKQLRRHNLIQGPLQTITWWASQVTSLTLGILFLQVAQVFPSGAERLHVRYNAWVNQRGALRFFDFLGLSVAVGAAKWTVLEREGSHLYDEKYFDLSSLLGTGSMELLNTPFESWSEEREALGLTPERVMELVDALDRFESRLILEEPLAAQNIHSLRTQKAFVIHLLENARLLRRKGESPSLPLLLLSSIDQYYGDLIGDPIAEWASDGNLSESLKNSGLTRSPAGRGRARELLVSQMAISAFLIRLHNAFGDFISDDDVIDYLGGVYEATISSTRGTTKKLIQMIKRATATAEAVLFFEEEGSDAELMKAIRHVVGEMSADISVLWSHPFTEERQLVGHRVPKSGSDQLVFGQGELLRSIRKAEREMARARSEGREPRKHILLIKNIEAMDPEVRTQLQELLRIRELTHSELGTVTLPENFQILMTQRYDANLEDDSFSDRVVKKRVRSSYGSKPKEFVPARRGLMRKGIEGVALSIGPGAPWIQLNPRLFSKLADTLRDGEHPLTQEMRDEIYLKTGLVLDSDTLCMISAMQETVNSGRTILRIEGPTGVGKTFAAQGFARLTGRTFLANPASEGTELTDWIGSIEQDAEGSFHFNGETTVKERLEEGGVVALSELNTLLDQNEKVSLAWWLVQIAETEPEPDGTKIIRLTEVPVPNGMPVHTIRIHPLSLIVVDTNPEGEYAVRGKFPEIFQETVPALTLGPFVNGGIEKYGEDFNRLSPYLDMFLKQDWIVNGQVKVRGIADKSERDHYVEKIIEIYLGVVNKYVLGEMGAGENVVFSVRELKRIAEDLQYAYFRGERGHELLAKAVFPHLRDRWVSEKDRESVDGVFWATLNSGTRSITRLGASLDDSGELNNFLSDQLFVKNRPVHLRVSSETDVRKILSAFIQHAKASLRVIPDTAQTDRYMLEGGLAPTDTGRMDFADGVLGRLIDEAEAHPDQQVVYVLENAHNLKPEVVVALNELLQDRKLYQKGRDTRRSLPLNAHILLVSRSDSDLNWSPAEQSRFVVRAVGQEESYENIGELRDVLSSVGLPDLNLTALMLGIKRAYQTFRLDLSRDSTRWGRVSHLKHARYLAKLAERVGEIPHEMLNSPLLHELAKKVFEEVFLADFPMEERKGRVDQYWAGVINEDVPWEAVPADRADASRAKYLTAFCRMLAFNPSTDPKLETVRSILNSIPNKHKWRPSQFPRLLTGRLCRGQIDRWGVDGFGHEGFTVRLSRLPWWTVIGPIGRLIVSIRYKTVYFIVLSDFSVLDIESVKVLNISLVLPTIEIFNDSKPGEEFYSDLKQLRDYYTRDTRPLSSILEWSKKLLSQHAKTVRWETVPGSSLVPGDIIQYSPHLINTINPWSILSSRLTLAQAYSQLAKINSVSIIQNKWTLPKRLPSLTLLGVIAYAMKTFFGRPSWDFIFQIMHTLVYLKDLLRGIHKFKPDAPASTQWLVIGGGQVANLATADLIPISNFSNIQRVAHSPPSFLPGLSSIPDPFVPLYGDKPFYFMENSQGQVTLNFKGKMYLTRHQRIKPHGESFVGDRPVALSLLRHPYREEVTPLTERDFLMETAELERVTTAALEAFSDGWSVDLEGPAGAGKTSVAKELALLLGLPAHVFQMHGERDLSDWIGMSRENSSGRIVLTNVPFRDDQGKQRYRQPLLDFLVNGGVFVADEGAIGDRGLEMMSWLSSIVQGDKKIYLEEFPGHVTEIDVHPDFHLVITNNPAETTQGRQVLKSEIAAHVHFIYVEEDNSPDVLERLFHYFLGEKGGLTNMQKDLLANILVDLHSSLKDRIGTDIGQDDADRNFISKREIRRVAALIQQSDLASNEGDGLYALFGAMRLVYEAMFPHPEERAKVLDGIRKVFLSHGLRDHQWDEFVSRQEAEINGRFGGAVSTAEGTTAHMTNALFDRGESILFIAETGARVGDSLRYVARERKARIVPVDAAPEHSELEVLGDLFPILEGRRHGGRRSHFVKGVITQHLMTLSELEDHSRGGESREETIVWIRNIDQWSEDIRTALNGFLEEGYLDLEVDEGRFVRFYKPPHVHFVADITADTVQDFSSAFFNRWIKIGVSRDSILPKAEGGLSDFENVLRQSYELDGNEIRCLSRIYAALLDVDDAKLWAGHERYGLGPDIFYAVAEGINLAKREDPRWRALLERIAHSGYDPRLRPAQGPPSGEETRSIWETHQRLSQEILFHELTRIVGGRFNPTQYSTKMSDRERFNSVLKIVLQMDELPSPGSRITLSSAGVAERIGHTPLHPGPGATPPLAIGSAHQLRYTDTIVGVLDTLARAATLGRTVALMGETGAAKTTIAGHFAELTGRKFYKYQTHAGSEQVDLTIDLEQTEEGDFKKRIKEVYSLLKEGHVVIDLDEANIAPKILWTLEPVIRGERWIFPIFPEEEPFEVGPDVLLILTYNPVRYAGRSEIDPRLLSPMIQVWMEGPSETERAQIMASVFGVWVDPSVGRSRTEILPAIEPVTPEEQVQPDTRTTPSGVAEEGVAGDPREGGGIDRFMRKGKETIDSDRSLEPTPIGHKKKKAHGVFDPELYPHTRHAAFTHYDEIKEEFTWTGASAAMVSAPRLSEAQRERLTRDFKRTHDIFSGRYRMDLEDGKPHVLPSAGAEMEVMDVQAFDLEGNPLELSLNIGKDGADNWFVQAPQATGVVDIHYWVAVPARYFGTQVAKGIPFQFARNIPTEVRDALKVMRIRENETDFRGVLYRMIEFFRDFSLEENGISSDHNSVYLDLIHSQCGVCRHRAFAFARTALGIGMEVRYVTTDVHAFAEVRVPGIGWIRVDLGGGGDPMNRDLSPLAHERHEARQSGDFPEPDNYQNNQEAYADRMEQAMQHQGVAPQRSQRVSPAPDQRVAVEQARRDKDISHRIQALKDDIILDTQEHDEASAMLKKGVGETEHVFYRMLKAMQSRVRTVKKAMKSGLEVDPVAFMLKKPKLFVTRKKVPKMQTTAVGVLMDFSGSMVQVAGLKDSLEFAVGAVGRNFWRLKEEAPKHFFYNISHFNSQPTPVVTFGDRLSAAENDQRVISMKGKIGQGGTNILEALEKERISFTSSREARGAKMKYVVLFTDGADLDSIAGGAFTEEMSNEMTKYREARIDVIAVGIGPGANDVRAFQGPGQHFVTINENHPEDIAETIARVAEHKMLKSGHLPPGDVTHFLKIGTRPTTHPASFLAVKTVREWGLNPWTWIVKVMPRLETSFLILLSPELVKILLLLGWVSPLAVGVGASLLAGILFSLIHAYLLTKQGETVSSKDILAWFLSGTVFAFPLTLVASGLMMGVLPALGLILFLPAFYLSLIPHEALNRAVVEGRLKSIPYVGRPLAWLFEKPMSVRGAGHQSLYPKEPRSRAFHLLSEMETQSAGLGRLKRGDVEARYPVKDRQGTLYQHAGQWGGPLSSSEWEEESRSVARLTGDSRTGAGSPFPLGTALDNSSLSHEFLIMANQLTDERVGEGQRDWLAAHLRTIAKDPQGNRGELIAGLALLHLVGGALHPVMGELPVAQVNDIEWVVQLLIQEKGERESIQSLFRKYADPVDRKVELIQRLEAAGRERVRDLNPEVLPIVSLIGLSHEEQVEASVYILGVAKGLQEKNDQRQVLVTGESADWGYFLKFKGQLNAVRDRVRPVNEEQVHGLIANLKLNVKNLSSYASREGLFPNKTIPSMSLVADLQHVDEYSVMSAKLDGIHIDVQSFSSLVQQIGEEISRLAFIFLQA